MLELIIISKMLTNNFNLVLESTKTSLLSVILARKLMML